jgi:hypothetical protein
MKSLFDEARPLDPGIERALRPFQYIREMALVCGDSFKNNPAR